MPLRRCRRQPLARQCSLAWNGLQIGVLSALLLVIAACNLASKNQSSATNAAGTVMVTLTPATAALSGGAQQQFTAQATTPGPPALKGGAAGSVQPEILFEASMGSISPTGLFSAPKVSSRTMVTITATSTSDTTVKAQASVTVDAPPAVTVAVTPDGVSIPSDGTQTFSASVKNASDQHVTWSASAGSISSAGVFHAPQVTTSTTVTITATSVADTTKSAAATVTVQASAPAVTVTVAPLGPSVPSSGTVQFSASVHNASNPAVVWSCTTGTISATGLYAAPAVSADTTASITAASVADPSAQTWTRVDITAPPAGSPLRITTSSLPRASAGTAYAAPLAAAGGSSPYLWSLTSGTLPVGISLDANDGAIIGLTNQSGSFTVTVQVTDSSSPQQAASESFSLEVQSASAPAYTIPESFFGIHVNKLSDPWPTTQGFKFGSYRTLGSQIKWNDINTAPGVYNWARLDRWLALAEQSGQDVMFTMFYTPAWASSNPTAGCANGSFPAGGCYPPKDLNADGTGSNQHFRNFISALMAHVGPGKIQYLEIWNEPNIQSEWTGTFPQLVRMAQDASTIAKGVDPNIKIVAPPETGDGGDPGLLMNWAAKFLAAGGGQYVDVIALHGYVVHPEDFLVRLENLRSVMAAYSVTDKQIFDTEGSWGIFSNTYDPDQQVAFTGRSYLVHASAQVDRYYWYGWDLLNTGNFYSYQTHAVTPPGVAYLQVYQWLHGASPSGACTANGTVWTCGYTRANGYRALAVWDAAQTCGGGSCTTRAYTVPAGFVQYRDLTGNLTVLHNSQMQISLKPVLLENHSAW